MKATAIAPSNIALIKYWGKKDEEQRIPCNPSISFCLDTLVTKTTVEFADLPEDIVQVDGKEDPATTLRVSRHLDLIRKRAGIDKRARIFSENNFPSSAGLSSSASGFAALTLAACSAAGLKLDERELSILARLGSGSAARSVPSGWVIWHSEGDAHAETIFPHDHWDLVDFVAIVSKEKKAVPSSAGQRSVWTSPFFEDRLRLLPKKIDRFMQSVRERDFPAFGAIVEQEALELHSIMLTQSPGLIYWSTGTLALMKLVRQLRPDLEAYFTMNTGQDVHIIAHAKDEKRLVDRLGSLDIVDEVIVARPSAGARLL